MPAPIFRRLEQPAEDYLAKVNAIVELDSTQDSSLTGMNSAVDPASNSVELEEKRSPPPEEVPDLVSERSDASTSGNKMGKQGVKTNEATIPLSSTSKKPEDIASVRNPITPDTSIDAILPLDTDFSRAQKMAQGTPETNRQEKRSLASGCKTPPPQSDDSRLEKEPSKSGGRQSYHSHRGRKIGARRNASNHRDDDESSSDDESSYFATHLPSPKSGRSFSISSNASNLSSPYPLQKQGSDASLSFSDESDDEHHNHTEGATGNGVHLSPVVNPNRAVVDMNLYPQRITRLHSVSSLVSSASSDQRGSDDDSNEGQEANRRRSFTGDDSITSSIPSVSSTGPESGGYFVPGAPHHHYSQQHQGYTNHHHNPSPGMPPQFYSQQPMTNQQMMAWSAPPPSDGEFEYTSSEYNSSTHTHQRVTSPYGVVGTPSQSSFISKSSTSTRPFAYSQGDQVAMRFNEGTMGKQASGAGGMGGNAQSGVRGALGGPSGIPGQPQGNVGRASQKSSSGEVDAKAASSANGGGTGPKASFTGRQTFKVYWQRWIMLFYMSVLNLLSDWTCYSVAPISLLTEEAFGNIDPERLVVVFLGANAVASACEPMLLARLGLRRTVLLGSLLLMIGSIIKSGGLPPIMEPSLEKGHAESSLYWGFFIVGLSQPLYQCTPALLSASWFPEEERTMATGVALNANQLGIGFAFIFGTLLVSKADDIPAYFGLLSQISTLCFIGTLLQFDDAPPTPPSASARVMRGNLNFKMPQIADRQIKRYFSGISSKNEKPKAPAPSPASNVALDEEKVSRSSKTKRAPRSASGSKRASSTRRRAAPKVQTANAENGLSAPSNAHYGSTSEAIEDLVHTMEEMDALVAHAQAPSPAPMSGRPTDAEGELGSPNPEDTNPDDSGPGFQGQIPMPSQGGIPAGQMPLPGSYSPYGYPPPGYAYHPYMDPRMQEQMQQAFYQQQMYYQQQMGQPPPPMMGTPGAPPPHPQVGYYAPPPPPLPMPYSYPHQHFAGGHGEFDPRFDPYDFDAYGDQGAEPKVTVSNHHLDIDIRDDQVIRSLHACMIRQGFSHALAAFTVSGIVINTLSTYMDYLVRLNGAPRSYTGIVGGAFQFGIMISSLIMGKQTDKTRAYYSVTMGMLVLGAFGLAECGVSLDSNNGGDLRWSLLLVAVLVGPLQPISTELGVEVAYPLSENTVLVIQQLFSNLLSALFIPFFKSLKDIGVTSYRGDEVIERPEYTFSFYLLIVLHSLVTLYFASFNGRYLRYEHELQKKEEEEQAEIDAQNGSDNVANLGEQQPLLSSV